MTASTIAPVPVGGDWPPTPAGTGSPAPVGTLAAILDNQSRNARLYGDAERIAGFTRRQRTDPHT